MSATTSPMDPTTPSPTSLSASSFMLQRACPSGGGASQGDQPRFLGDVELAVLPVLGPLLVQGGVEPSAASWARVDASLPAQPGPLMRALAPSRHEVVLGCECMFGWYWLADRCRDEKLPFILGHAPYMWLIHGAKAK